MANLTRKLLVFIIALVAVNKCGSLLSELDRIRNKANATTSTNYPTPVVTATNPADNTIAPYTQADITLYFSTNLDSNSLTVQNQFGPCSGNIQLSFDGFNKCFALSVDASMNPNIRVIPNVFSKGLGLQIRVTSGVLSDHGVAAQAYTSLIGFKVGALCGGQNCFFSTSTPLMAIAGQSTGIFLIRGGTLAGKYLVYTSGTSITTIIDPTYQISYQGPAFPSACYALATSNIHINFYISPASTGGHANSQYIMISGATNACYFDHTSNMFSTTGLGVLGAGAHVFQPLTGSEAGNTLIVQGGSSININRYNATTGIINLGAYLLSIGANSGAHSVRLNAGTYANQWLIWSANGTATGHIFQESPAAITVTKTGTFLNNAGAQSFQIGAGTHADKVLTLAGGGTINTSLYDSGLVTAISGGAATPNSLFLPAGNTPAAGSQIFWQPGNKSYNDPLIVIGSAGTATVRYNSSGDAFIPGQPTTGAVTAYTAASYMPELASDAFFLVNGYLTTNTSVYGANSFTFHGSRTPGVTPNLGANVFAPQSGGLQGYTVIVGGNGVPTTAIYDPIKHVIVQGNSLTGSAFSYSFNVTINQGQHIGKTLIMGINTATGYNLYNTNGTFLDPVAGGPGWPALSSGLGQGATAFPIDGTTKLMIVTGGATNNTILMDFGFAIPTVINGTAMQLASCPTNVNSDPLTLRVVNPATGLAKQLVYCTGTFLATFDHSTQLYSGNVALPTTGGVGIQGLIIPSGSYANYAMIIHGGVSTSATVINPTTLVPSAVTWLSTGCPSANVGAGSQLLPIQYGTNAGKYLLIGGGDTLNTCLFDPAGPTFSPGPPVNTVSSPGYQVAAGSVAFKTGGGLYPLGFVLLSAANRNVWSTYVP